MTMSAVIKPRPEPRWNRLLWGVVFSGVGKEAPMLIGGLWAPDLGGAPYPGKPTRALLFTTRQQARNWCSDTMRKWHDGRQRDDTVMRWRVRAVRVRETVVIEAAGSGSSVPPDRWYCVSRHGLATLCADEGDARRMAEQCAVEYPRAAPYRAMVLGDVAAERERCAAICEREASDPPGAIPERQNSHADGWMDGAQTCADAIHRAPNVRANLPP